MTSKYREFIDKEINPAMEKVNQRYKSLEGRIKSVEKQRHVPNPPQNRLKRWVDDLMEVSNLIETVIEQNKKLQELLLKAIELANTDEGLLNCIVSRHLS